MALCDSSSVRNDTSPTWYGLGSWSPGFAWPKSTMTGVTWLRVRGYGNTATVSSAP
jgi:hypothetical protein